MRTFLLVLTLWSGCASNPFGIQKSEFWITGDGRRLHRVEFPVAVQHAPMGDGAVKSYADAVQLINETAGCELFTKPVQVMREVFTGVEAKCWNRVGKPEDDEGLGNCENFFDEIGVIQVSVVHIPCYRAFPEEQLLVAVHELMHTLGFDHDWGNALGQVMYPYVNWGGLEFEEEDVKLLRGMCK